MLKFMVLAAPRSGSTWAANWLTTDWSLCMHDPVLEHTIDELDHLSYAGDLGASCTALSLLPQFVNAHPARKVVLHRDFDEINRSLVKLGLNELGAAWDGALEKISGMHVRYRDLFDPRRAERIYEHLLRRPMSRERHASLARMRIAPDLGEVRIEAAALLDFRRRVALALGAGCTA